MFLTTGIFGDFGGLAGEFLTFKTGIFGGPDIRWNLETWDPDKDWKFEREDPEPHGNLAHAWNQRDTIDWQ